MRVETCLLEPGFNNWRIHRHTLAQLDCCPGYLIDDARTIGPGTNGAKAVIPHYPARKTGREY